MLSLLKKLRLKFARISINTKFLAATSGLLTLIILLVALSIYSKRQQSQYHDQLDVSAQAAINVEKVNGLIFAVVMESRGIYMSSDPAMVKHYGNELLHRSRELADVLEEWQQIVRHDDIELFSTFKNRILDFIHFREELVRRASTISQSAAREWGDNEANRSIRIALNEDIAALATVYFKRAHTTTQLGKQAELASLLLMILCLGAIALTGLIAFLFKASVITPLQDITSTTDKIASGKIAFTIPHTNRQDEIGKLAQAVQQLRDTTERNRDLQKRELAASRERDDLEGELEENKCHLLAAINNMAPGLIMLDAQANVIVMNDSYRNLYKLPKNIMDKRCSLRDVLTYRAESGLFSGDINAYIGAILIRIANGKPSTRHVELKDGRSIRVFEQPMADGGWVSTHEDFTKQRQLERTLERTEHLLVTIIDNVGEAILAKDLLSHRYLFVNRAAEALFGLPRAAIVGRTPGEVFGEETAGRIESSETTRSLHLGTSAAVQTIETSGNGQRVVAIRHFPASGSDGDGHVLLSLIEDRTAQAFQMPRIRSA